MILSMLIGFGAGVVTMLAGIALLLLWVFRKGVYSRG